MTWAFLIPLVLGFTANAASAFTAAYARRWGERPGQSASFVLRNVLGIPVWAIGFILAVRTPSRLLLPPGAATTVAGWTLIAFGGAAILWALRALGRRAAAPSMRDTLVVDGPFRHVRHPIHVAAGLEFIGLWLLVPSLAVAVACLLGLAWLLIQTRLEEADLLVRLPDYRAYMAEDLQHGLPRRLPVGSRFGAAT